MGNLIQIQTFGTFAISGECGRIDDTQNRSKKVWALLAILLCNHGHVVSQNELIELLWNDDKDDSNPTSALKTTLHRARALLDQVVPSGGHTLILNKSGGYVWNEEISIQLDIEQFEYLCRTPASPEADGGLVRLQMALELYKGAFLNKLSSESWVIPRSVYYHNLYFQTVNRVLELLETHGNWLKAEEICREALRQEPYREEIYQHLMQNLLAMQRQSEAAAVFEEMSKLLLANFGVMPDQESRRLYREALRTTNRQTVPVGVIREQLRESDPITGALICDYDFFKMIYQAEARMVVRSGNAVHIALLSLSGDRGKELARRSLDLAMDNIEELIRTNLRKGDVITRCSPSQILIMLPQANFENSEMVCKRILRAFSQKYPHSPAVVEYVIYPLEPAGDEAVVRTI